LKTTVEFALDRPDIGTEFGRYLRELDLSRFDSWLDCPGGLWTFQFKSNATQAIPMPRSPGPLNGAGGDTKWYVSSNAGVPPLARPFV